MLIIGVTGSIATGKSTVASMFKKYGAVVLDADQIARKSLEPDGKCYQKVIDLFGKEVLDKGFINRNKIASIVFADKMKRVQLENIIHPVVRAEFKRSIRRLKRIELNECVILDVPLLFETGLHRQVDRVVVVKADHHIQLERAQKRSGLTEQDLQNRKDSQLEIEEKIRLADFIIDNNQTLKQTEKQVKNIWLKLFPTVKK